MASIFLTVFIGTSPFGLVFRSFWHYNNTGIAKSKILKIWEILYRFDIVMERKKGGIRLDASEDSMGLGVGSRLALAEETAGQAHQHRRACHMHRNALHFYLMALL